MYKLFWKGKDKLIVIDDVDDALTDPRKKTLLKEALENEEEKEVSWGSATDRLVDEAGNVIPTSFETTSRFCVIGNKLTARVEEHLSALLSRAFCVEFRPTIYEVHKYVGEWFTDEEVYDFVGENLPLIIDIDVRDYNQALKFKRHGEDWKQMLRGRWTEDARLVPVLTILADPTLRSSGRRRVERYVQMTGNSRRTFMYLQAEIRRLRGTDEDVEPVKLKLRRNSGTDDGREPPPVPPPPEPAPEPPRPTLPDAGT